MAACCSDAHRCRRRSRTDAVCAHGNCQSPGGACRKDTHSRALRCRPRSEVKVSRRATVTPASEPRSTIPGVLPKRLKAIQAERPRTRAHERPAADRRSIRRLHAANSWIDRNARTLQPTGCKPYATCLIRKSSIRLPDFNFAASQRGVFPRPAHVSDGRSGFRNFGTTVGYGRRPVDELARSVSTPPLSCFRRFSSMRFSASSEAASLEAISSWSAHNSSVDIDLKSFRFTTVPNHDSKHLSSLVENMSRIRPIQISLSGQLRISFSGQLRTPVGP